MPRIAIAADIEKKETLEEDKLPDVFEQALAQGNMPPPDIPLTDREAAPLGDNGKEMFEKFITFVADNVNKMSSIANLRQDPTFIELNSALTQFESVQLSMIFVYEEIRFEETLAKEAYQHEFDTKYCATRDKYNKSDLPAAKYLSNKEIEMRTNVDYYTTLRPLWNEWKNLEHKLSALRRLMDSWDRFSYTLGTLSNNVRTEVNAHFTSEKGSVDD
jgi:hypothetical protein